MIKRLNVNSVNELTTIPRSETLIMAGSILTASVRTVIVFTTLYPGDATFAEAGFTLTNGGNSYTAIAVNSLGLHSTNTISTYLPGTNSYTYDANGNLLSDGLRYFNPRRQRTS